MLPQDREDSYFSLSCLSPFDIPTGAPVPHLHHGNTHIHTRTTLQQIPSLPDPRPQLPTLFHDKAINRLLARTNWSPTATLFNYKCSCMPL